MIRRVDVLLMVILLTLIPLSAVGSARAQNQTVPYLYYFSNTLNAFVIERADGTDRRILGDGLLAPDVSPYRDSGYDAYYQIDGPGWSASGRWFAWSADTFTGYYDHGSGAKPFVIRSDGAQRVTILDNLAEAQMAWAPHDDLLLVASQLDPFNGANKNTFIGLINPARNAPVAAFSQPSSPSVDCGIGDMTWTADGHGIAQYTVASVPAIYEFEARQGFFIVDTKGNVVQKVFDRIVTDEPFGFGCAAALSAAGDIAYQFQHNLIVENLITGVRHVIPDIFSADKEFEGAHLYWSGDGRYGLLFGGRGGTVGESPAPVRLVMRDENRAVLLLSKSLWVETGPGQSTPMWSPDGDHALLLSGDENGERLYHVDAAHGTISLLLEGAGTGAVSFAWTGSAQALVGRGVVEANHVHTSRMDRYDFSAGMSSILPDIAQTQQAGRGSPRYQFGLSPDGKEMAYVHDGLVIHDINTGADRRIRPSPRGYHYDGGGEATWSKDGNWLFVYEESGETTPYPRDVSIVRVDGQMRRNLTYTDFSPTPVLLNWLPPQVKLDSLPPALASTPYPGPQRALHGDDWHEELAWSPDSRQIAALNRETPPTVWNVESGIASMPFPSTQIGFYDTLSWQQQADGAYGLILNKGLPPASILNRPPRILASSADGNLEVRDDLRLYDKRSGKFIRTVGTEEDQVAERGASFSPDGTLLAIGGRYAPVQIWNTQTWQLLRTLPDPSFAVAFSPDGKWLATGSSWDVQLWEVAALLRD